jgi:prepilin-type N-terminal cleavage/methylation domain-containing protein
MATLIESLTALAIFAVGASASASWLARSSQAAAHASARTRALAVATDAEARLRAGGAPDVPRLRAEARRALGAAATADATCGEAACLVRLRWPGGTLDWGVAR